MTDNTYITTSTFSLKSSWSKIDFTWLSHSKTRGSRRDSAAFPGRMLTCHSDDQFENNEMGGACSTYGGEERCIQGF